MSDKDNTSDEKTEPKVKGHPKPSFLRDNPYGLSDQQTRFLTEYLIDQNSARASRIVGVNKDVAQAWLKNENFNAAIDAYFARLRRDSDELIQKTLAELLCVMTSDIRDYVTWTKGNKVKLIASDQLKSSKAIKAIEKTKFGVKLVLHDKVRSIELMMQGMGMMKKPKEDRPVESPKTDNEKELSLLEALTRAHEDRRKMKMLSQGMVEVEAQVVKEDKDVK